MERAPTLKPLSPMQFVIATLCGIGQSHAEIADTLHITIGTVRDHLNKISRKLPGDLPREARIVAWVRGAPLDVLEGRSLRYEVMIEGERAGKTAFAATAS
jgi:hypothetical protein